MPHDRAEQLRERLLATFRVEAAEHLGVMGAELDALAVDMAAADAQQRLALLFRTMHTFKGAARSVGLSDVESLCALCEILLRGLSEGKTKLDAGIVGGIQEACDTLAALLDGGVTAQRLEDIAARLEGARTPASVADAPGRQTPPPHVEAAADISPSPAAEVSGPQPRAGAEDTRLNTIRVEVGRLDHLSLLAEELMIPKLAAGENARSARALADKMAQLHHSLRRDRESRDAGSRRQGGTRQFEDGLRGIEGDARALAASLRAGHKRLRDAADNVIDELRRIRMMPAFTVFEAFPRMVRDLARETGKDVAWEVQGAEIEIDRKLLHLVKDPLIHLVRNAVDHGIERPEDRAAAGKQRQGRVMARIEQTEGGRVAIEITDDGHGLDPTAIKRAAVRLRALSAEQAETVSDDEAIDLAFRAGVSTSPVISSISGHGLGLAIVRELVESVEGRLSVHSTPGTGTAIRLDLPATIATYRGLLVGSGGNRLLWPLESIERAIGVPRQEISPSLARGAYEFEGKALAFGRLSTIFGLAGKEQPRRDERACIPAIVVRSANRRGILLIDEVIGEREILVKELRPPLRRLRNVLAAGLLGTGELVLVARPADVLHSIHAAPRDDQEETVRAEPRCFRILVVDDSITTRTMERNLFEAAGYEVHTVADGVEALNQLRGESFDLVVSDVDMPRMDGFELAERVRADDRLAQIPVILVTALESREDKERGLRVGANAYVLKSAFNQSHLLEIVRRLT